MSWSEGLQTIGHDPKSGSHKYVGRSPVLQTLENLSTGFGVFVEEDP